ncbi:MAG: glycoside hydrolase family protein [Candidatus Puniceispirillaceae bacterium]|jgi:lysozyme
MDDNTDKLIKQIKRHEGNVMNNGKHEPYEDHLGYLTIGYGRLIDPEIKGGISESEAEMLLMNDLVAFMDAAKSYSWYDSLDDVRKAVIVNMLFNLGQPRFNKFVAMHEALKAQNYATAAAEMLDSRWAKQVKGRAKELAEQMRTGKWQLY